MLGGDSGVHKRIKNIGNAKYSIQYKGYIFFKKYIREFKANIITLSCGFITHQVDVRQMTTVA